MRLAIKIAKQFLLSNKSQSILIVCAIAVGISVQLFIGLLIQGLQADLIDSTIGDASHISILGKEDTFENDLKIYDAIDNVDGVNKVSPLLVENAFMKYDQENYPMAINGVEIDENIYNLNDKLVEGSLPSKDDEVIIGMFYENIALGESVIFTLPNGVSKEYKVVGKFDFGNNTANEKFAYSTLSGLQSFAGKENEVSAVEIQVDEVFMSNEIASKIDVEDYNIVTWQDSNASLLTALSSQTMSSLIIQVFIIISVTLAISSVLIISVVQKSKQIGILKAMGLNNSTISKVFVSQGFILGTIGSFCGIVLGLGLLYTFTTFAVDESGEPVISIIYSMRFIILSFSIGVTVSTIASFIPARKSHKLSAMEVIGNG